MAITLPPPGWPYPKRMIGFALSFAMLVITCGCNRVKAQQNRSGDGSGRVTDIAIGSNVQQRSVKRLGMNIAGQNFWGSSQVLRNLIFRNPGFEGETWQSILRCKTATANSCTDGNTWTQWPADFLRNAQFEFVTGAAKGMKGTVISSDMSSKGDSGHGVTFTFVNGDRTPAAGDFVIVRLNIPGNAEVGWWPNISGGATLSTEFSDLAPNSPGKQALRMTAFGPGQQAGVDSYFDSDEKRSFVQLKGVYRLSFRAKGVLGNNQLSVSVERQDKTHGTKILFNNNNKTVGLSKTWRDYSFDFPTAENGSALGPIKVSFSVGGSVALLDDVSLTPAATSPDNPTAFRDEVVSTLRELKPGVLRYMDSGTDFGSSIDNMIAPPFARKRAGASTQEIKHEDIPLGLHEFLQLCQVLGAEPWYTMPAGMSSTEMQNLIEYLGGYASTPYGAKRAALGQRDAWTSVFPVIHLELGNEQWNGPSFYGSTINDAAAYGKHSADIFAAAKSASAYTPNKFDLIIGSRGDTDNSWWTEQELANGAHYDSTAVAPYLFNHFNDASSNEAIFGSMFAQPEMMDSRPTGVMAMQAKAAKGAKATLSIYEVNLGTSSGSAKQSDLDAAIPSIGAGITVVEHMLLMMRDLGVTTQAIWSLTQFANGFNNSDGIKQDVPLFGAVVDMGGPTNLRRPLFFAEQLANEAILKDMLATSLTGANPTWNQTLSTNDKIQIDNAHYLQTFAFADGAQRSLIVFNLSRNEALPITISGVAAPSGSVQMSMLTSKNITDSNERESKVAVTKKTLTDFNPRVPYSVPPFSMTVLRWTSAH
jgi:alpha-L-arabinofuranosidase